MKNNKYYFLILFFCFFQSSCIVIVPNFAGFSSGYKKLNEHDKSFIKTTDEKISNLKNKDSIIYFINGTQMNEFIKEAKDVLVYLWAPECSSEYCVPLSIIQYYCTEKNLKLIIVSEYFSMKKIKEQYTADYEKPLFAIDINYYKTNYCDKYIRKFIKDMLKDMIYDDSVGYSRFFLFCNSELVKSSNFLDSNI